MGPNSRRAQQAAAEQRNIPSRARFSKPPPNKRGGGRGGKGGRGGRSGGRGRDVVEPSAAEQTRDRVVNKIAQRVQSNSSSVSSSTATASRTRHPLAGINGKIDTSKYDPVTLSDSSIELVEKLLRSLGVMEQSETQKTPIANNRTGSLMPSNQTIDATSSRGRPSKDPEQEAPTMTFNHISEDENHEDANGSKPRRNYLQGGSGYEEYEDDADMDDDGHLIDSSMWAEEQLRLHQEKNVADGGNDGDENGSDDIHEEDNLEVEVVDEMDFSETALFRHLTNHLSFKHGDANRACRAVESWTSGDDNDKAENEDDKLNSDQLALAMDWMCLHLTEEQLKCGFDRNPASLKVERQQQGRPPIVGRGSSSSSNVTTRAIPHESISIAKPLTDDKEWRDSTNKEARKLNFARLGFHRSEAEQACDQTGFTPLSVSAQDDESALRILLHLLEKEEIPGSVAGNEVNGNKADLEFATMEREQEVQALEAIYDKDFVNHEPNGRYTLKLLLADALEKPARSDQCKLHVFIRPTYPIMGPPLMLFTNPTLPPSLLRRIQLMMIKEAEQMVGEPCVFSIMEYLSQNLLELQRDFVREQRAKEFAAEQQRVRKMAGHDTKITEQAIEAQYDADDQKRPLGRRQKQKLRAAEKSFDRHSQAAEEEKIKEQQRLKRLQRIQTESLSHRTTRAEKLIAERAKERTREEAERAAGSAMTAAFNRGASSDVARKEASKARKASLRDNGEDVSSDEEEDEQSDEVREEKKNDADDFEQKDDGFGTNQVSIEDEENDNDVGKSKGPSETTMAFMDRLRKCYEDAARQKATQVSTLNDVKDRSGGGSSNHDLSMLHLSESKQKAKLERKETQDVTVEGSSEEKIDIGDSVRRVPRPVFVPSKALTDVMEDVIKSQSEQPWLLSPEARVPTLLNDDDNDGKLTDEQEEQRAKISRTLRQQLQRKYRSADEWGRKNESVPHTKGSHNNRSGPLPQQFHRMMSQRSRLPAYLMRENIVKMIEDNQITVISGDTGCGKTTQVPQLVLDDLIWKGKGAEANIIVTQPRRISAIGVSERIAAERCEKVGETAGYSIRLENKRSAKTRLLLCTTGILLRRLQCDPDLASVSHVVLDEVHERDLNTDFLLIILKDLLLRRKSLKLVLMSATLNADTFSTYFDGCPTVSIPGRAHPVTEYRLEDVLQATGYEIMEHSDYAKKKQKGKPQNEETNQLSKSALKKMYYPKYDSKVINSLSIVDESIVNYELIAKLLEYITLNNEAGAILVFLPGMMEITKTVEELYKNAFFTDSSKVVVYPLHSSLSTAEQTAIFEVPPEGVRKIVISTNIAETSITIEDVVFVVDTGRVKENRQDEVNQMPTLVECWVSRASAKQRRGRAGRVQAGIAYHMYSSHSYENELQEYQLPEMLRVGLEDLVLQVLLLDLGEPSIFLTKAVNPPSALAIRNSLKLLEGLGAVQCDWHDDNSLKKLLPTPPESSKKSGQEEALSCETLSVESGLTALGFHLATLPVDPRVGKMMIFGAMFGCIDPALTIAASMTARNPFMSPFDKRDAADAARKEFATEGSDHLTTLFAFNQWKEVRKNKGERASQMFLRENFLSRLTLFQMEDLRRQFADLLVDIGFLPKKFRLETRGRNTKQTERKAVDFSSSDANANSQNLHLVKAILCAGLYPNIIVAPKSLINQSGSSKADKAAGEVPFLSLKGDVYLHPSTISFTEKKLSSRYCCYHEIVKTSKIYVRDCTSVSEFAILLFGGSLKLYHMHGVITIDNWLRFRIARRPAALVKHLRSQMETMLLKKIVSPDQEVTGSPEGRALIQAISTLLEKEVNQTQFPDRSGAEIVKPWTPGEQGDGDGRGNNNNNSGNERRDGPQGRTSGRGGRKGGGRGRGRGGRGSGGRN